jgi:hypothetical protein
MTTKPTGRPVGRPRKPRPPRRPRVGRPAQPFLEDPDRYAIALLDAMLALEMGSARACAMGVAVWQVGSQADPPRVLAGRVVTNWERRRTRKNSTAGTLEGRAVTLRTKQRRSCTEQEGRWRVAMAKAFTLVLRARDPAAVKLAILAHAISIGEGEFAGRVMLPMLDAKFSSPEFPPNFVSTTTCI